MPINTSGPVMGVAQSFLGRAIGKNAMATSEAASLQALQHLEDKRFEKVNSRIIEDPDKHVNFNDAQSEISLLNSFTREKDAALQHAKKTMSRRAYEKRAQEIRATFNKKVANEGTWFGHLYREED